MENKRIVVIGGTGFIGRPLVNLLSEKGFDITVISRKPRQDSEKIRYLKGDVLDREFLSREIKNFDIIFYLTAIIRTKNKKLYKQNPLGLNNTIEAMRKNKIKRILYFSSINTILPRTGYYGNSKKESEEILRQSDLDYMIVRPSYVYGINKDNDFFKLYKIIKRFYLCPLIGRGKTKFEPINNNDVSGLTLEIIRKWKRGSLFYLSGSSRVTMDEVADIIIKESKTNPIKIHVPVSILRYFKKLMPFDVEGYYHDRTPKDDGKILYGKSDFKNDLKKIISSNNSTLDIKSKRVFY